MPPWAHDSPHWTGKASIRSQKEPVCLLVSRPSAKDLSGNRPLWSSLVRPLTTPPMGAPRRTRGIPPAPAHPILSRPKSNDSGAAWRSVHRRCTSHPSWVWEGHTCRGAGPQLTTQVSSCLCSPCELQYCFCPWQVHVPIVIHQPTALSR